MPEKKPMIGQVNPSNGRAVHELKTPLTALRLKLQLAKRLVQTAKSDSRPDKKLLEILEGCDLDLQRALELIDKSKISRAS